MNGSGAGKSNPTYAVRRFLVPEITRLSRRHGAPEGALLAMTLEDMIDAIVNGELFADSHERFADDEI